MGGPWRNLGDLHIVPGALPPEGCPEMPGSLTLTQGCQLSPRHGLEESIHLFTQQIYIECLLGAGGCSRVRDRAVGQTSKTLLSERIFCRKRPSINK